MKNIFTKLLPLMLCLALFSCQKKASNGFQNHSPHLSYPFVKTVTGSSSSDIFYYDALGRVIGINNNPYTYVGDTAYSYGNSYWILNPAGLAILTSYPLGYIHNIYDSSGYLIKWYLPGTTDGDTMYYENNNPVITVQSGDTSGGQPFYTVTFNYYNTAVNTIGNDNFGQPYLGKQAANLPDSSHIVMIYTSSFNLSQANNTPPAIKVFFTYNFNSSGYVSWQGAKQIFYGGGVSDTVTSFASYTYY